MANEQLYIDDVRRWLELFQGEGSNCKSLKYKAYAKMVKNVGNLAALCIAQHDEAQQEKLARWTLEDELTAANDALSRMADREEELQAKHKKRVAELAEAREEIARLREALAFYADYHGNTVEDGLYVNDRGVPDYGSKAKQALGETYNNQRIDSFAIEGNE